MVGQTLGHYEILEKLGAGGMGVVYRAEDTSLKRQVALKVLPPTFADNPTRLERFQREAEALAALNHPNIVTIYSVEEVAQVRFLTMELVRGRRLSELIPKAGMPVEQIFDLAVPLADALAAAHDKGIIHRDLKPANVMVTAQGRAKLLDFGLAQLRPEAQTADATALPTEPLTGHGLAAGTVPYMSPEQLRGESLDGRSDLFSLGIVLYEMATGSRPFRAESAASLISSILNDTPGDLDVLRRDLPHHLARIVRRCLEKEPSRRYQSALDVRNELVDLERERSTENLLARTRARDPAKPSRPPAWWPIALVVVAGLLAASGWWLDRRRAPAPAPAIEAAAEVPRIVVLPFENLGPADDEYFADGMGEEISSRLANLRGLGVISRTSAMQYKTDRPPLRQIGEELDVSYVLAGTVRWARTPQGAGRVRITPRLTRVRDDRQLWSESYDRNMEDIFEIQAEIASAVLTKLGATLSEAERLQIEAQPTPSFEAYQAYLRAMEQSRSRWLPDQTAEVVDRLFERAVELDPSFAAAWAQHARFHFRRHYIGLDPDGDRLRRGRQALDRALELAPHHPAVQLARGYLHYHGESDYREARSQFLAASEAQPGRIEPLEALGLIHRRLGEWDEASSAFQRAVRLDPLDPNNHYRLAAVYDALGSFEEADGAWERALALAPENANFCAAAATRLVYFRGAIGEARDVLDRCTDQEDLFLHLTRAWLEYCDRDYEAAIAALEDRPLGGRGEGWRMLLLGLSYLHLEQPDRARRLFGAGVELVEPGVQELIERGLTSRGQEFWALSLLYALLDRREEGLALVERVAESRADDFYEGRPGSAIIRAWVHHFGGDHEAAIGLLEQALSTPSAFTSPFGFFLTPTMLRIHPDLDPIRDHPRFQALLEKLPQPESKPDSPR